METLLDKPWGGQHYGMTPLHILCNGDDRDGTRCVSTDFKDAFEILLNYGAD